MNPISAHLHLSILNSETHRRHRPSTRAVAFVLLTEKYDTQLIYGSLVLYDLCSHALPSN